MLEWIAVILIAGTNAHYAPALDPHSATKEMCINAELIIQDFRPDLNGVCYNVRTGQYHDFIPAQRGLTISQEFSRLQADYYLKTHRR